jgi:hypothetical protein
MKKVPTLTTDQVREAFSNVDDDEATEENRHNFDVWLVNERHRVADLAIAKERKRIFVSIMANVNKTVAAAKRGDNPIDMTWLFEEIMKED